MELISEKKKKHNTELHRVYVSQKAEVEHSYDEDHSIFH